MWLNKWSNSLKFLVHPQCFWTSLFLYNQKRLISIVLPLIILYNAFKNWIWFQGLAFTLEERQALGIHGLLPPRVKTQEEQVKHCKMCLDRLTDSLDKYIYLAGLMVNK